MIVRHLANSTVTVVLIGSRTSVRPLVQYGIEESVKRGNGLLGIRIHHLKDHMGRISAAGAFQPCRRASNSRSMTGTEMRSVSQRKSKPPGSARRACARRDASPAAHTSSNSTQSTSRAWMARVGSLIGVAVEALLPDRQGVAEIVLAGFREPSRRPARRGRRARACRAAGWPRPSRPSPRTPRRPGPRAARAPAANRDRARRRARRRCRRRRPGAALAEAAMGRMAVAARSPGLFRGSLGRSQRRGLQRFQQLQAHRRQVGRRQVRPRLGQLRGQQRHLAGGQHPLDQPSPVVHQSAAAGLSASQVEDRHARLMGQPLPAPAGSDGSGRMRNGRREAYFKPVENENAGRHRGGRHSNSPPNEPLGRHGPPTARQADSRAASTSRASPPGPSSPRQGLQRRLVDRRRPAAGSSSGSRASGISSSTSKAPAAAAARARASGWLANRCEHLGRHEPGSACRPAVARRRRPARRSARCGRRKRPRWAAGRSSARRLPAPAPPANRGRGPTRPARGGPWPTARRWPPASW